MSYDISWIGLRVEMYKFFHLQYNYCISLSSLQTVIKTELVVTNSFFICFAALSTIKMNEAFTCSVADQAALISSRQIRVNSGAR